MSDPEYIDEERLCFVNTERKYLFVNIPKNASTSIRQSLYFDSRLSYESIENVKNYFSFTVINNPLKRAISSFFELRLLRKDGGYKITEQSEWFKEEDLLHSFEGFLCFIDGNFYDVHTYPQSWFLEKKGLAPQDLSLVMLLENIKGDFKKLLSQCPQAQRLTQGLFAPALKHSRKSPSKEKKLLSDFVFDTPRIQKQIRELYPADQELYLKTKNDT